MSARNAVRFVACAMLFGMAIQAQAQSTDQLVRKYKPLAGDGTSTLVSGLESGSDFTISGTTFHTATGKLGNGEVNIALALTEEKLSQEKISNPTAVQLRDALEPILQQRADGNGWGEIANAMGFKLGDVMRSDKAQGRDRVARGERSERQLERPETAERPEKPERSERPERPERAERGR